ncbi:MAG: TrkA C-terminal domain-containing protein, partial [Nitrososphaerales archaeon]
IDLGIVAVNETATTVSSIRNATISGERLHRMTQICDDRAEIVRTVITITSKVVGKKVKDLNLNKKIFCIDRESEVVLPDDKTIFKEGDVVYAVVLPEESNKLVSLLHGEDS